MKKGSSGVRDYFFADGKKVLFAFKASIVECE
jgi:hypothetical protein